MITITQTGSFAKLEAMLKNARASSYRSVLDKYGQEGVAALSAATPKDTGLTASSWGYEIVEAGDTITLYWTNSNTSTGVNVAVMIQYGHATANGSYVYGIDYINPALAPIFDKLADAVYKEVSGNGNAG